MLSFEELAASRRQWLHGILMPWCCEAPLKELRRIELDWTNFAGQVDPRATLWTWAWSRFPVLVHEGFPGVNETLEVRVTLSDGTLVSGYPDNQLSDRGQLFLLGRSDDSGRTEFEQLGPFSIDTIARVELCNPEAQPAPAMPDRPATTLPPHTPDDERI